MASPVRNLSEVIEVDIASGTSLSAAVNLLGRVVCGVYMPAAWTAADLTFQAAGTVDGTYVDLYATDGSELTVTTAASRFVAIDPINFLGVNFIKVRSGTSAAAQNQAADRTLLFAAGIPSIEQ